MWQRKGSVRTSSKDTYEDKVYNVTRKRKVIYHAEMQKDNLLLACKNAVLLYDISNMKKVGSIKVNTHIAAFLPESNCIVYVDSKENRRDRLNIYDYMLKELVGWMRMDFEVNEVRARKSCIALAGRDSISVIHFPTLKPIFYE